MKNNKIRGGGAPDRFDDWRRGVSPRFRARIYHGRPFLFRKTLPSPRYTTHYKLSIRSSTAMEEKELDFRITIAIYSLRGKERRALESECLCKSSSFEMEDGYGSLLVAILESMNTTALTQTKGV